MNILTYQLLIRGEPEILTIAILQYDLPLYCFVRQKGATDKGSSLTN